LFGASLAVVAAIALAIVAPKRAHA